MPSSPSDGELDGEGAAVESPADLADPPRVGSAHIGAGGAGLLGPLHEEGERVAVPALAARE
jgi:hypothetical protein